jgi:hypothetical protein
MFATILVISSTGAKLGDFLKSGRVQLASYPPRELCLCPVDACHLKCSFFSSESVSQSVLESMSVRLYSSFFNPLTQLRILVDLFL